MLEKSTGIKPKKSNWTVDNGEILLCVEKNKPVAWEEKWEKNKLGAERTGLFFKGVWNKNGKGGFAK